MDEKPTEEDIREFEELSSEAERDLYWSIGRAITAWSTTEGFLVVIAAMLLDTTRDKAGLVIYSITNFHSWLSIIDELFVIDPQFSGLRSNWTEIAERLKKLNDTRVRLAHHAVQRGKGIDAFAAGDDVMEFFPSLKPNSSDVRSKSKKHSALQIAEVSDFVGNLAPVAEKIAELIDRMTPIYIGPKKALAEKIRQIRQKVSELQARKGP